MKDSKTGSVTVAQPSLAEVTAKLDASVRVREAVPELLRRYPQAQGALLELLWLVQGEYGWLPEAGIEWASQKAGCSPVHAWGVANFYTMYKKIPTGRFFLQFCQNIVCHIRGAESIIEHAEKALGISSQGGTTEDGLFTMARVECLGMCGYGPAMMVNDEFATDVENDKLVLARDDRGLTAERFDRIIDWCRKEAEKGPAPASQDALGDLIIGTAGHPGAEGATAQPQTFNYAPPPPALHVAAAEREGKVVLTWKAGPETLSLTVEKKAPGGAEFVKAGEAGGRDKEWLDEEAVPGTVYRMIAETKLGTARPSQEAVFGGAA